MLIILNHVLIHLHVPKRFPNFVAESKIPRGFRARPFRATAKKRKNKSKSSSMKKEITFQIVDAIRHDLRDHRKESYYESAKLSGMRAEVIKKLEADTRNPSCAGSSIYAYIDSYCSRFPACAYKIFYNIAMVVAQQEVFSDQQEGGNNER